MVLRDLLARRAVDAVRVELLNQSFQTSGIVWILPVELKEGKRRVGSLGAFRVISVYLGHTKSILEVSTDVKGISPLKIGLKL